MPEEIVLALDLNRIEDEVVDIAGSTSLAGFIAVNVGEWIGPEEGILNLITTHLIEVRDEVVNFVEDIVRSRILVKLDADVLNISDGRVAALGLVRELGDVLNADEVIVQTKGIFMILSDVLNIDEGLARARGLVKVFDDVVNIGGTSSVTGFIVACVGEWVEPREGIVKLVTATLVEVVDEVLNLVEGLARSQIIVGIVDEAENIVEALARSSIIVRIEDEVLNFVEGIIELVTEEGAALVEIVAETINLVESIDLARVMVRVITDKMSIVLSGGAWIIGKVKWNKDDESSDGWSKD